MNAASNDKISARRLWVGVSAAFLLLAAAWAVAFVVAHQARIESVPVEKGGR